MHRDIAALNERIAGESAFVGQIREQVSRVIVGQEYVIDRLLIALLADGHVLLEGVPGLAKTLTVKTLADVIATGFQRLQFTPDLLPADLIGTMIYRDGSFVAKQGPIFANLILADEINRAPAKVQSALLEAMQERQVTIGDETFPLPQPFLVLATQNPIEQEGTYPLPEAQVDRFMLKLAVTYPQRDEERLILRRMTAAEEPVAEPVVQPETILHARRTVRDIYMDDKIVEYILDLVEATRAPGKHDLDSLDGLIEYGASPRAGIALTLCAKGFAFLRGRGYVTPEDVRSIGLDVLRHRVIVTYEAEAEEITPEQVVQTILDEIEAP